MISLGVQQLVVSLVSLSLCVITNGEELIALKCVLICLLACIRITVRECLFACLHVYVGCRLFRYCICWETQVQTQNIKQCVDVDVDFVDFVDFLESVT